MAKLLNRPVLSALALVSIVSGNALAEVYMCKDEKGRKVFSDVQCKSERVEVNVKVHSGSADESGSNNNVFDQLDNLENNSSSNRNSSYSNRSNRSSYGSGRKEMSASDRDKIATLEDRLANVGKERFGHATPLQRRMDAEEKQSIRQQIKNIKDKYR